jgi:hypothetical protein
MLIQPSENNHKNRLNIHRAHQIRVITRRTAEAVRWIAIKQKAWLATEANQTAKKEKNSSECSYRQIWRNAGGRKRWRGSRRGRPWDPFCPTKSFAAALSVAHSDGTVGMYRGSEEEGGGESLSCSQPPAASFLHFTLPHPTSLPVLKSVCEIFLHVLSSFSPGSIHS